MPIDIIGRAKTDIEHQFLDIDERVKYVGLQINGEKP